VAAQDLFTPSLQDHVPRHERTALQPWRLGSQVYVAFFGGVLAVTAIALINAGLLRAPGRVRAGILACGAAGLAVVVLLASLLLSGDDVPEGARTALTLVGVAAWGGMYLLQRPWDRVYSSFSRESDEDELYESLVGPGLVAVIAGFVTQTAIVTAVG
jgi:hypothetical protein